MVFKDCLLTILFPFFIFIDFFINVFFINFLDTIFFLGFFFLISFFLLLKFFFLTTLVFEDFFNNLDLTDTFFFNAFFFTEVFLFIFFTAIINQSSSKISKLIFCNSLQLRTFESFIKSSRLLFIFFKFKSLVLRFFNDFSTS